MINNLILLFAFILLLQGCIEKSKHKIKSKNLDISQEIVLERNTLKNKPLKEIQKKDVELDKVNSKPMDSNDLEFLIGYIKDTTPLRLMKLNYEEVFSFNKQLKNLPPELLSHIKGEPLGKDLLKFDDYNSFYLIDHFVVGNYFYFRIIEEDEVCCRTMFLISIDTKDYIIKNIFNFGIYGGDGGWHTTSSENWKTDSTLYVVEKNIFDEDLSEGGYERKTETNHYTYSISNGNLAITFLDSIITEEIIN
ncbi:hypothetical protein EI427_24530 [Flammeovirga pectinis]|uniref:Uncharacterized protein n=1 Tax=Flammeovirga pectinis TaxID=2494373 RepID=A0A3S9PBG1_9BACT|nr:hypothetical protein [Flammeovirga pectinis]AZQ65382.1 hypothetical protein EI427_24530 [Flammeovirga pectinis]